MWLSSKCFAGMNNTNVRYKTTQDPVLGMSCESDLPFSIVTMC